MRCVIYANDMEPLTIVELSEFAEAYLWRHGRVILEVRTLAVREVINNIPTSFDHEFRSVRLYADLFYRHGKKHLIICTDDEESALLLKCVFLPGQYGQLHELERKAFAKGFMDAWQRLGRFL